MNVVASLLQPLKRMHWKYRGLLWEYHRRFSDSMTLQTQQGVFTIPFGEDNAICRHLYTRREYELEWIADSLDFLRSKQLCPQKGQGTVLDIGANNGVISIGMLATGEFDKAIAIEPDPRNFESLERNVSANGFESRFTCLNFAAADQRSELAFELSAINFGDHRVRSQRPDASSTELFDESKRQVIKVPADSIDNLLARLNEKLAQQVSLVWVDVQGYEGFVFRGSKDLLSRGIPVVSEIWPYGIQRAGMSLQTYCEIAGSLWSNYWTIQRGKFVQHPINDLPAYVTRLGRGTRHENVIFTA